VLTEHERCLRSAFAGAGGQEIDTQGDAFFAAFARATDAVSAAVTIQRALPTCSWPDEAEVRVRIGIHTAEPKVGQDRYIGLGVHRAARICAAGHGGQVLISSATRELIEESLPGELELRDVGTHRLKDLDRPEHLFQLAGPGLGSEFPPVRTAEAHAGAETPFAGRESELARAAHAAVVARRALRRRTLLLAMLGGVIAAAVAVPLFALGSDQGPGSRKAEQGPLTVQPNSLAVIDPATNRLTAALRVGETPGSVAVAENAVWVGNIDEGTLSRVDPQRRRVVKTIGIPVTPRALASGEGALWIADNGCDASCAARAGASVTGTGEYPPASLTKFDPGREEVLWTVPLGTGGDGRVDVALVGGSVWLSNENDWSVYRIDIASGDVQAKIAKNVDGPTALAAGADALWVVSFADSSIARVNLRTARVETTILTDLAKHIAAGPAGIWVVTERAHTIWRIDPENNRPAGTITVDGLGNAIAVGQKRIWLAHQAGGYVSSIDPRTGKTVKIRVGPPLTDVALGSGAVWVTVR
jgi:DNA-binding beta-propeller fold protein YncE